MAGPMAPPRHNFYQRRLTRERVIEKFYVELTIAKMGRASAKVPWPQGKVTKCLTGPCDSASYETKHWASCWKVPSSSVVYSSLELLWHFWAQTFCFSNKLLHDAAVTGPQTTFWGARQPIYNFPSLMPFLFLWPTNKSPQILFLLKLLAKLSLLFLTTLLKVESMPATLTSPLTLLLYLNPFIWLLLPIQPCSRRLSGY